ncbi:hypothetical protein [uncultured Tenacibaculum sp.]|uniref:hypothetical protein n=1 Tax=uncultured Tenacibaculum sp. TaxID=174713 RepID=UPI0026150EED|nr:hypothetical protein [uncultured Tenacibaculum sp.]
MKKTLLLIAFLLVTQFVSAQFDFLDPYRKATIVFKDGIEKTGEAKFISGDRIKFKETEKSKAVKLNYETVDKIIISQTTYQYRTIKRKRKPNLFEIVRDGKLTVFSFTRDMPGSHSPGNSNMNFGESFEFFYVARKGETQLTDLELDRLSAKRFHKAATVYFKDCPLLVEKINTKEFKRDNFLEIADFYNNNCQ